MGKVKKPHCSGVLTSSLVISLHDRQTEAQATTSLLPGQHVSLASTLCIISKSNSGGKFAHCPCSINAVEKPDEEEEEEEASGAICARPRRSLCFLSELFFDMFPISRTKLFIGIFSNFDLPELKKEKDKFNQAKCF